MSITEKFWNLPFASGVFLLWDGNLSPDPLLGHHHPLLISHWSLRNWSLVIEPLVIERGV
ncbi:MAG: hypothetical protein ACO2PK_11525 [Armatimonadota bacterium]